MSIFRFSTILLTLGIFASCKTNVADQAPHLEQVVSTLSSLLSPEDSSTTSSHSTKHAEYNESCTIDLEWSSEQDAINLSKILKESLEKSGCKILMFSTYATVGSSDNGSWSGQIESFKDPDFVGSSYSINFEESSGEILSVEKFYLSCILRYKGSNILLHCKMFPEERRIHYDASLIK